MGSGAISSLASWPERRPVDSVLSQAAVATAVNELTEGGAHQRAEPTQTLQKQQRWNSLGGFCVESFEEMI